MNYIYHIDGSQPATDQIFVFGSNQSGIHGAGAARYAFKWRGFPWGVPEGLRGMAYGIPTKDTTLKALDLETIKAGVERFLDFARSNPDLKFFVTRIGCGLAG